MYAYFILDGERLGNQALETTEGKEVQTFHPDFPRVISLFAPQFPPSLDAVKSRNF